MVVHKPEGEIIPPSVVTRAAELAAWYSDARNAARVEVHLCPASEVRKPHRAPPVLVELGKYRSVKVTPRPFEPDPE